MKQHISFELEFKKNPHPGKLIVMEGIDGAGKTTQAKEIVKTLNKQGYNAAYTKEPTDMVIGQFIREKILSGNMEINSLALQYLFNADRVMHMEKIELLLKKGMIIVMDRYFWSSVAYALSDIDLPAGRQDVSKDWILAAFSILSFYHQFIVPEATFYLDIPVDIALRRISDSGKHGEIYDNGEKLPAIYRNYQLLMKEFPEKFTVVDAARKQEEITGEIVEKIKSNL